ncbi:MAG: glycoside hydrolase family 13 protein [Rikenellaceae bacterium]
MKLKNIIAIMALLAFGSCAQNSASQSGSREVDLSLVSENQGEVTRVEPLSWWTEMQTPLQLMIQGDNISEWSVSVANSDEVKIKKVHKADNPNFLFLDVSISIDTPAGDYTLLFEREGKQFKLPYTIEKRKAGSATRKSFTTADMIYLLMPDRFANGDPDNDSTACTTDKLDREALFGRHGGDIQGIIDHLDYIADLGATAIWSTPLLLDNEPQHSYHGYACADYYKIDPRYGSNELYKTMVSESHKRGVKVIMDIVTNHCGISHWWIEDMPFKDWIHNYDTFTQTNHIFSTNIDPNASKHDLQLQESGWFDTSMPDMNLDNEYLLHYFKQWAIWWVEYASLDGLRVDTYPYNEKVPMSEWCAAVRAEYPNINIVGECWTSSVPQLAYWQTGNGNADGFDSNLPSIMDFPLRDAICEALPGSGQHWGQGMFKVYNAISHDFAYADLSNMLIFTANHDTDRVGDIVKKNSDRANIAMTLLATLRGIPQIFSGDEMMFTSKDLSMGHGGLRVDFPGGWPGDKVNLFDAAQRDTMQTKVFDHTRTLFQWRKGKEVIHSGKTLHFAARDNTYAYFRYNDTDAVFVYVNNSRSTKTIPWENYSEITTSLGAGRNVLTGEQVVIDGQTKIKPRQSIVVEYTRKL